MCRPSRKISIRLTLNNRSLKEWLGYIESLHPEEMELGLERIAAVFDRLAVKNDHARIVTVAGTNGKGSTLSFLESCYRAAGYRTGCYTSPHLVRYNERIRIDGTEVGDTELCEAFARVEDARGNIQLTYFEFGTLAALWLFFQTSLDVVLLETGLGGRLDAVNIIDSDVAVITTIDLDHTDWLGNTRELIGFEKAGIFRSNRPAVCADPGPPDSISRQAHEIGAELVRINRDYSFDVKAGHWSWQGMGARHAQLPAPGLPGAHQYYNAATAIAVIEILQDDLPVDEQAIRIGITAPGITGRIDIVATRPEVILDVSHNPQALGVLGQYVHSNPVAGKTVAVCGMLKDKDLQKGLATMLPFIDHWYLADLPGARGASAELLAVALKATENRAPIQCYASVSSAFDAACREAVADDRLLIFGSFLTVGAIMARL